VKQSFHLSRRTGSRFESLKMERSSMYVKSRSNCDLTCWSRGGHSCQTVGSAYKMDLRHCFLGQTVACLALAYIHLGSRLLDRKMVEDCA
jgi:hypothetical protein